MIDLEYLLNIVIKRINNSLSTSDKTTIFTVSTTAKKNSANKCYSTPIRISEKIVLAGIVVSSIDQAIKSITMLDGKVDYIAIDVEKKVLLNNSKYSKIQNKSLSQIAEIYAKKSEIIQFKPNDLTVDAVWSVCSIKKNNLEGKQISVIGSGNIGSKLALKFVESGCKVNVYRRDMSKLKQIVSGLNQIKCNFEKSSIKISKSVLEACSGSDIILGCNTGEPIIDYLDIQNSKQDALFMDVGKGTFNISCVKRLRQSNKLVLRTDVSTSIENFFKSILEMKNKIDNYDLIRYYQGRSIISTGVFGLDGDIVVNPLLKKNSIIGICDGKGDLKISKNNDNKKIFSEISKKVKFDSVNNIKKK